MDRKILAWARRVKRRRGGKLPALWLFTDAVRLPDPAPAILALPRGAAGVVLRPEGLAAAGIERVAALCRARGLTLSVAGDARLAARLGAGLHLRGGRRPGVVATHMPALTGSAHAPAEARRCRAADVALVFISPVFATGSHPSGRTLGVLGWRRLARAVPGRAAALGGIDGRTVRRLPAECRGIGAIGALAAD